jgi:phosphonate transport system substrate-binding protein
MLAGGPALAQQEEGVLRFGMIPSEDAAKLIRDSGPFIEQLEKATGMKVKPFVAIDYAGVIEALKAKKLEAAFLGPFSYVLARDVVGAPVEPVGRGVMAHTGKSSYRALFITPAKSDVNKLEDLKGKTFAFVDPGSTSGNLVPRYVFKTVGIDPDKDFKALRWSGTHDGSLIAVAEGKVDGAVIADEVYDLNLKKGIVKPERVRVIHASDPIPGSPFVVRTDLSADLRDKITKGFMSVKNANFGKLGTILEMDPAKDSDYNVLRNLVKELKLDLKKVK